MFRVMGFQCKRQRSEENFLIVCSTYFLDDFNRPPLLHMQNFSEITSFDNLSSKVLLLPWHLKADLRPCQKLYVIYGQATLYVLKHTFLNNLPTAVY